MKPTLGGFLLLCRHCPLASSTEPGHLLGHRNMGMAQPMLRAFQVSFCCYVCDCLSYQFMFLEFPTQETTSKDLWQDHDSESLPMDTSKAKRLA